MTQTETLKEQLEQVTEARKHLAEKIKSVSMKGGTSNGEALMHLTNAFIAICDSESALSGVVGDQPGAPKMNIVKPKGH